MNDIDDQIRDALAAEQKVLFDDDQDQLAHFESIKTMFRGTVKIFTFAHIAVMLVFITMIVICAVQFFRVETTREMIAWATGFGAFVTLEALAELFFMIEVNKYVVLWEVKQLELQVASLSTLMRMPSGEEDGSQTVS